MTVIFCSQKPCLYWHESGCQRQTVMLDSVRANKELLCLGFRYVKLSSRQGPSPVPAMEPVAEAYAVAARRGDGLYRVPADT
jgi:hypothetical protein